MEFDGLKSKKIILSISLRFNNKAFIQQKILIFFEKKLPKNLHNSKKGSNFALAIGKQTR